jgi:hypothetical protein
MEERHLRTILVAALFTSLIGLAPSAASAQGISVGPGGVRVETGRERRYDRYDRRERFERRGERCRVEVERRRNRFGEVVTRRTRVCR